MASWFDDNQDTPQAAPAGAKSRYTSADIAAVFKQLTGRDPGPGEADWGNNIDQQYYDKIVASLKATPEAQAYQQQQQQQAVPTGPWQSAPAPAAAAPAGGDWATKDYSNIDNVKAFFKSKGVDVSDSSAQYWATKFNSPEFAGDRNYFFQRMNQAEEFIGPPGSPGNPGGEQGYGDLLKPFTENFNYADFQAPTQADLQASPGFQASLDRAANTLQHSASAHGSLLSGSTLQALSDQAADLTTQGYGNLFNQKAQEYSTNRGNALDSYNQRRANFYQNQDSPFAKLFGLAQLQSSNQNALNANNLGYAQLGAGTIQSGSGAYNGLLTGGANAAAAGQVGAGNAYQGLYGNISQAALLAALSGRGGSGNNSGSNFRSPTPGNPNLYYPY